MAATPPPPEVSVRRGAKSPEALRLKIANDPGDTEPINFAQVTGPVHITATDLSDGRSKLWKGSIAAQTSTLLTVVYACKAAGSDIPKQARFELMAEYNTPGGKRRAGPMILQVT
jgi:hypothetical protein